MRDLLSRPDRPCYGLKDQNGTEKVTMVLLTVDELPVVVHNLFNLPLSGEVSDRLSCN